MMKKVVEIVNVEGEGLEAFFDQEIMIWCECYFYHGILEGVTDTCILLKEAKVVYKTGPLCEVGFEDAQKLPGVWYVMKSKIESFGHWSSK